MRPAPGRLAGRGRAAQPTEREKLAVIEEVNPSKEVVVHCLTGVVPVGQVQRWQRDVTGLYFGLE